MKHASFAASALLFATFSTSLAAPASASPAHPVSAAHNPPIVNILCKYGTPHCVNPNPGPKVPTVNSNRLPDSGWTDPDCKYYGNCNTGTPGAWGDPAAARAGSSMPYAVQRGTPLYR